MSEVTNQDLANLSSEQRQKFNHLAQENSDEIRLFQVDDATLSIPDEEEVVRIYDVLKLESQVQLQARGGPLVFPDKLSI